MSDAEFFLRGEDFEGPGFVEEDGRVDAIPFWILLVVFLWEGTGKGRREREMYSENRRGRKRRQFSASI